MRKKVNNILFFFLNTINKNNFLQNITLKNKYMVFIIKINY